jgi:hypothetical protein
MTDDNLLCVICIKCHLLKGNSFFEAPCCEALFTLELSSGRLCCCISYLHEMRRHQGQNLFLNVTLRTVCSNADFKLLK